jgi:hypothetical protein
MWWRQTCQPIRGVQNFAMDYWLGKKFATGSTSHAHFAPLPPTELVTSRVRGHGKSGGPIRSHGQESILQYDSNRTVHHQNHLATRTQFVDSKPATSTMMDGAGVCQYMLVGGPIRMRLFWDGTVFGLLVSYVMFISSSLPLAYRSRVYAMLVFWLRIVT